MARYYPLHHIDQLALNEPFGIIRQAGHSVERYIPDDKEWVEAPSDWDYLLGNEPGARDITEAEADELIARNKLARISREVFRPRDA